MHRRRRTLRFDSHLHLLPQPRASLPVLASSTALAVQPLVRSIVQQLLASVEEQAEIQRRAGLNCVSLLGALDHGLQNLYQLEQLAYQPHCLAACESEPAPSWQSQRPSDTNREQIRARVTGREWAKEKSQSCDMGEWRRREKEERAQLQKCSRNELVSLGQNCRLSENEDRSEEIQSLLRRKKELRMESKQFQRLPSEAARTVLLDKKEKKWFGQNDEGEAFELISSQLKPAREAAPAIQLGNVKVLPGQQIAFPSSLKRRPIVELPTRKTKRRKEVGDTCVLIEQLYEADGCYNQETVIEEACRMHKGVRIAPKEKPITSILRLPTIR